MPRRTIWKILGTCSERGLTSRRALLPADYNPEQEVLLVDREGLGDERRFNLSDEGVEEKIIQLTRRVLRDPHKRIADPLEIINPEWLDKRMVAQLKKRDRIQSFVDFSFEDMVQESQIAWRHQVADDAGKTYKPSHYDHGNGILTADVDGDQLLDLYFISQIGENQLWKNVGAGRFQNITAKSGLALRDLVCVSGAFADIDNDGDQDLFVTSILGGNKLFENNGKGNFKDISKASGLDYKGTFCWSKLLRLRQGWLARPLCFECWEIHDRKDEHHGGETPK